MKFADGQQILYRIPILWAQNHTVDSIFEKQLLILLPYHLLRYESFLKNSGSNTKKLEQLLTDYQKISSALELCTDDKKSSLYENDCQFFKHSTVFFNPSRISVFATHPIFSILSGFKVALVAVE